MKKSIVKLIEKLACCHVWKEYKSIDVWPIVKGTYPSQIIKIMICKKCGKIKKITI